MSNPRLIVAIPFLLTRLFINLTSMLASVNILDISTISPVLLPAKILISVLYLSADESTCSHSASMRRSLSFSGKLRTFTQSVRCIVTPLPLVTNPTISSPGTGLQHFENLTATSCMPLTTIPPRVFLYLSLFFASCCTMPSNTSLSVTSAFLRFSFSSTSLLTT